MRAAGAGLWAVPVVAVVTRNNGGSGGQQATQVVAPANHGGPAVASCTMAGSPGGCITFVCAVPPTYTECVGTPPAPLGCNGAPNICFCDTDISGVCRCFANDPCADLIDCPNLGAPNAGCPAGFFCVNPFSCCGVAKCARVCA